MCVFVCLCVCICVFAYVYFLSLLNVSIYENVIFTEFKL